jgi:hypothetical protein
MCGRKTLTQNKGHQNSNASIERRQQEEIAILQKDGVPFFREVDAFLRKRKKLPFSVFKSLKRTFRLNEQTSIIRS